MYRHPSAQVLYMTPVQALDHRLLPPDLPLIVSDLLDIKHCTRQLELYSRVCMGVQDVNAQHLRFCRHQYRGAVRANRPVVKYVTLSSNLGRR